jgi:hypothetical protein
VDTILWKEKKTSLSAPPAKSDSHGVEREPGFAWRSPEDRRGKSRLIA